MDAPESKNRPMWRVPMNARGYATAKFPGYQSRFGDGHPNRVQCVAMARSTGQRCRKDALRGAPTCNSHGGHWHAYRNAPEGFVSSRSGTASTRNALAKLATIERFPVGEAWPEHGSPVKRGLVIETARNRRLGLTK